MGFCETRAPQGAVGGRREGIPALGSEAGKRGRSSLDGTVRGLPNPARHVWWSRGTKGCLAAFSAHALRFATG